jgi:hypothetical protein
MTKDSCHREEALRKLPVSDSLALRLYEAGFAPEAICKCLGIEPAALASQLRITEARLAALRGELFLH